MSLRSAASAGSNSVSMICRARSPRQRAADSMMRPAMSNTRRDWEAMESTSSAIVGSNCLKLCISELYSCSMLFNCVSWASMRDSSGSVRTV
ncbi:hypothetical protein D3C71_1903630 [compost metagenome]